MKHKKHHVGKHLKSASHKAKGHDPHQHASHKAANAAIGLPHDMFAHDEEQYGAGAPNENLPAVAGPSSGGGYEGGGEMGGMHANECDED